MAWAIFATYAGVVVVKDSVLIWPGRDNFGRRKAADRERIGVFFGVPGRPAPGKRTRLVTMRE